MKKICVCLLVLVSSSLFGQVNLVQNSSFEDTAFCVNGPYVNVETPPWFNPTISTPDYYSSYLYCGYNWNNAYDYQQPHSGNCMIGLFCYEQNGERDYLETPLSYPLVSGRQYFVKFYCAAAAYSHYLVDKIGIYFSTDTVTSANYPYAINVTPQIHSPSGIILNDSINWTEVSGIFTATGGEKYLTVGEFYLNNQLTVDSSGSANVAVGYYYIDDVSVLDYDSLTGIHYNLSSPEINIHPNPASDFIAISFDKSRDAAIRLVDLLGNTILTTEVINKKECSINVSAVAAGCYFLQIVNKRTSTTTTKKIMII